MSEQEKCPMCGKEGKGAGYWYCGTTHNSSYKVVDQTELCKGRAEAIAQTNERVRGRYRKDLSILKEMRQSIWDFNGYEDHGTKELMIMRDWILELEQLLTHGPKDESEANND